VGLEPVAVATRALSGGRVEAWVVNHLSDSISIVEVDPANLATARVTRTLLVGDEPRDIVFAGPGGTRAFITVAHRGQHRTNPTIASVPGAGDPQLTTEGIGRADVWVFEATALGAALGGTPLTILTLFGDTPRALATDGNTVYAAVFHSGNRTTSITEMVVSANGGLPPNPVGSTPGGPATGLIVKFNPANSRWEDEIARNWSSQVAFSLPDQDVFVIDANTNPAPTQTGSVSGVGTVLFNMAVRPNSLGQLYVTNTEARNQIRFEPVLRGHLTESRITVINGTTPTPVHLNPHIDYAAVPGPQSEVDDSLAFPTDLVFTPNGQTVFVAGVGSGKVGVFSTSALEGGNVSPRQLLTVGLAPSGLAYDSVRDRLYVLNRIDRTISIVSDASQGTRAVTGSVSLRFDAEPAAVRNGRKFLYDAAGTSGHGDAACFSCHIYGDFDSLAWDLGDPFGSVVANTNPFRAGSGGPFHPIKGPMTTQTLRGMASNGPMHWRGDRTGGGVNALNTDLAFKAFNPAFVGLLGHGSELDASAMQAFTDFVLTVVLPPNPIRDLKNTLNTAQAAGSNFFQNDLVDDGRTCFFCHRLPTGTDGLSSIEGEPQEFKIAHLRNLYQKIGMFGFPGQPNTGNQVRGFGFLHDGSIDTVSSFLTAAVFNFPNDVARRNVEQFVLAFDTGLAPMVGQQVTVTPVTVNDSTVITRIQDMIDRANAGDCDLVVKGVLGGVARGAVFAGNDSFQPDRNADAVLSSTALRSLAATAGQELTYTCVPPGNGARIGVDRDEDGFFDLTETEASSDPADPLSSPGSGSTTTTTTLPGGSVRIRATSMTLKDGSAVNGPNRRKLPFTSSTKTDPTGNRIVAPVLGGPGDPTIAGATLRVYNPITHADDVTVSLVTGPDGTWSTNPGGTLFTWKGLNPLGPVKRVVLKADKLSIRGGKSLWAYTLGEASQGSVALRFRVGNGPEWCAQGGQSGFPPKSDVQDRFIAMRKTPAPAVCP
jgi:hypothetical protein